MRPQVPGLWSGAFSRATHLPFSTLGPALAAEAMSWSGVLSGNSRFYCAEYGRRHNDVRYSLDRYRDQERGQDLNTVPPLVVEPCSDPDPDTDLRSTG